MKTLIRVVGLMLSGVWMAQAMATVTPVSDARGEMIARAAIDSGKGFGDSQVGVTMQLISATGEVRERRLDIRTIEVAADGDRTLMLFSYPGDQAGIGLLSHAHPGAPDEQWLYLPSLKRVKQIASQNRSGPFVGSEFAFEDLEPADLRRYRYRALTDDVVGGEPCNVIERIPLSEYSGYSRQKVWIHARYHRYEKIEYYDKDGALLKTLRFSGYQVFEQRFWRPAEMHMSNHQSGRKTSMFLKGYRFRTGLSVAAFSLNSLQRAR